MVEISLYRTKISDHIEINRTLEEALEHLPSNTPIYLTELDVKFDPKELLFKFRDIEIKFPNPLDKKYDNKLHQKVVFSRDGSEVLAYSVGSIGGPSGLVAIHYKKDNLSTKLLHWLPEYLSNNPTPVYVAKHLILANSAIIYPTIHNVPIGTPGANAIDSIKYFNNGKIVPLIYINPYIVNVMTRKGKANYDYNSNEEVIFSYLFFGSGAHEKFHDVSREIRNSLPTDVGSMLVEEAVGTLVPVYAMIDKYKLRKKRIGNAPLDEVLEPIDLFIDVLAQSLVDFHSMFYSKIARINPFLTEANDIDIDSLGVELASILQYTKNKLETTPNLLEDYKDILRKGISDLRAVAERYNRSTLPFLVAQFFQP